MLVLGGMRLVVGAMRMRVIVPVPARVAVVIIVPVRVIMGVAVLVLRAVLVRMSMLKFVRVLVGVPLVRVRVIMIVIVIVIVRMIVIVPVIVLVTHHGLPSPALAFGSLRMRWAAIAAPKPLSMLTTTTPDAQLVSIANSAVKPPSAVP